MAISMSGQAASFLGALALGGVLGLIYDVFRISRLAFRLPAALIAAEDILFYLISGVVLFSYLMEASSGEVRGFILIGAFLGWLLYYFTAGRLVMALSGKLIAAFKKIIRLVLLPVIWILQFLQKIGRKAAFFFRGKACKAKIRLKSHASMLYNIMRRKMDAVQPSPQPRRHPPAKSAATGRRRISARNGGRTAHGGSARGKSKKQT